MVQAPMKPVKLYLGHAGHCLAKESHAATDGKNREITFYALFGLIQHPDKGWILYDTGYTERFYEATKKYPNKLYSIMTRVFVTEANEVKTQLQQFGLRATDIKHIVITHFHADHIGGLKDFPNAAIYCSRKAYMQARDIVPALGFTKGVLKLLMPEDIESRLHFVEDICTPIKDDFFGIRYDLFNDGSLYAYPLPGHAAGQIGILLYNGKKNIFLIADACWLKKAYEKLILPSQLIRVFVESWKEYKLTVNNMHRFHKQYPDVLIVPTHCYETTKGLVLKENELSEV